MQPIGTIAALGAPGVTQLTSHLPWGWFAAMAIVDLALMAVVVSRRLRARRASRFERRPSPAEALVLRSGWWVPPSRVLGLPVDPAVYAWPLHREYMVRRLG